MCGNGIAMPHPFTHRLAVREESGFRKKSLNKQMVKIIKE